MSYKVKIENVNTEKHRKLINWCSQELSDGVRPKFNGKLDSWRILCYDLYDTVEFEFKNLDHAVLFSLVWL